MGQNSFATKACYITITVGLLALGVDKQSNSINFTIMVTFAYFDAFYLAREREYRILYEHLIDVTKRKNIKPHSLIVSEKINEFQIIFSPIVLMFYLSIFVILILFNCLCSFQ
ncbi:hypothetical protein BHC48_02215 [Snodgrassella communis]|uniref:Uncharacterized protein n=1 Tax=Snodgrassella alvi TaxID=1196083 RepID=A0A2N9XSS1_9NEIS|nr:hypothetical protein BHC48_02215 [Snodgrassella communis]